MARNDTEDTGAEVAVLSDNLITQFAHMASMIPSEDGSGHERIVEALLAAESLDQLDDPWESTKADKLAGKVLRIDSLTRRPSDFKTGLGVFLVVRSTDTHTGEAVTWTTGSVSIVAQLVRAYALGAIPCYAELIIADRPTEAGYRPHHLKFWGSPASDQTGAMAPPDADE